MQKKLSMCVCTCVYIIPNENFFSNKKETYFIIEKYISSSEKLRRTAAANSSNAAYLFAQSNMNYRER